MNSYSTSWWNLLLINRPREDERLSWPCWLTYSGWFTHINDYPSAAGPVQTSESSPIRDRRSTTKPPYQLHYTTSDHSHTMYLIYSSTDFRWQMDPWPDMTLQKWLTCCLVPFLVWTLAEAIYLLVNSLHHASANTLLNIGELRHLLIRYMYTVSP